MATSKVPEFAQSFMASFSKEDGLQIWSRDRACHLDWRRLVSGSRFWHYGKPECRYRSQLQYAQRCDNWSGKPRQTKRCACSWRLRLAWCQLNYCWWRSFRQRRSRCTEHLCKLRRTKPFDCDWAPMQNHFSRWGNRRIYKQQGLNNKIGFTCLIQDRGGGIVFANYSELATQRALARSDASGR